MVQDERKGSFLRWLLGQLTAVGYSVTWGVVEAADYGVPSADRGVCLLGCVIVFRASCLRQHMGRRGCCLLARCEMR
jgi:hypothetical protein